RTQLNTALLERLGEGDALVVVAGEAASHCVAASGQDMLSQWDADRLRGTVFLTDCMSPVAGFEAAAEDFLQKLRNAGVGCETAATLASRLA
ncbi:MAG: cysteine hydrolase, partial [Burkholderiaceae bacterium]